MSGYEIVSKTVSVEGRANALVACPDGKVILGGGAEASDDSVVISTSRPVRSMRWFVVAKGDGTYNLTLYAICAQAAE